MKYLFGICLFFVSLLSGYGLFVSVFDHEKQKRSMASIKNNYDLTCFSGDDYRQAVKERIVGGLKITRKDGMLGLHLGHFTFADSQVDRSDICGDRKERSISSSLQVVSKKLGCKEYPQVSLLFSGDSEATSGSKRQLLVETSCEVSTDLSHTEVIWIPWDQLAHEAPFEGDAQYSQPTKLSIKTMHILDQWPAKWNLEKIELKGESDTININQDDIRKIAGRPLVFEFKR